MARVEELPHHKMTNQKWISVSTLTLVPEVYTKASTLLLKGCPVRTRLQ